jgi:hypothetical protein
MATLTTIFRTSKVDQTGDQTPFAPIFRAFDKAACADALAAGHVWISTLQHCRTTEDAKRRDALEGSKTWKTGDVVGDGTDPTVAEIARRLGFPVTAASNFVFSNNEITERVTDGLVICASWEPVDKFGPYIVRIDQVREFFHAVSNALMMARYLDPPAGTKRGYLTRVTYTAREYQALNNDPGHPGLVKDPYFKDEKEVRLLWPLNRPAPQPFLLKRAHVGQYCTRIA